MRGLDPLVPLTLDKDALSIFCKLPEPIFQQELKLFIFPKSGLDIPASPSRPAHYDAFGILSRQLDLLLWLSNARENATGIHRALIGSDSCGFLQKIVASRVSSIWRWEERDVWRHKGLAMTCFGNIMENMDESELRGHVPREMIETAVAIKDDGEAPLAQRDQATFMLQRYTIAADRCGVEPYHREAGAATED
ncbi:hypothetical protein FRC05_010472 [Tulasnella sp. 425]|nr:hypothetical protein FRC05_010472 [Tulasnella sp. 425]